MIFRGVNFNVTHPWRVDDRTRLQTPTTNVQTRNRISTNKHWNGFEFAITARRGREVRSVTADSGRSARGSVQLGGGSSSATASTLLGGRTRNAKARGANTRHRGRRRRSFAGAHRPELRAVSGWGPATAGNKRRR